ncbi:hypothetical protein PIB30_003875 [Stylosanthes scabra]|uniref:GATA-type domain-containing protein n=1 Tax=Stylosanthes scabra TaxID=79078 RepID=A0ABU6T4J8_9FABA|nr:hypothetical protein [Stylosanthes scabra]
MKDDLKNNTENININNNNECSSTTLINTCPNPISNKRCYVASICSFGSDGSARGMLGGPRCRRCQQERGVLLQSDGSNRYCTNYYCRTTRTPMWRKGPLGYKTLCNACGIDYMKQVTSRGSEITTTLPDFAAELRSDHSKSECSADV